MSFYGNIPLLSRYGISQGVYGLFPWLAYYPGKKEILYIIATGGQIIRYGDYLVHEFYGSDTFDVTQEGSGLFNDVTVFGQAGGGGGGADGAYGGGGGAGGNDEVIVSAILGANAVIIGSGGTFNADGNDTNLLGLTFVGGGRGGRRPATDVGDGGSGGGAVGGFNVLNGGGLGTLGQGNDGGIGGVIGAYGGGGGGGGAAIHRHFSKGYDMDEIHKLGWKHVHEDRETLAKKLKELELK